MPTPEEVAELVAAEQQQLDQKDEETHDGFINLDKHQLDVNRQHKKFRDEERARVKESERADTAEKALEELQVKQAKVVIPPVPDKYSDTFEADIKERDEAIAKQSTQDAANEVAAAERQKKDDARKTEAEKALTKRVTGFDSNMVSHGLNPVETKTAADTVIGYGISDAFQDVLLEDPDGPLFVQYLAANPVELEEMNRMSVFQLVNHMNGDIRQKALLLKPKTSNAPDPPLKIKGGGAPEQREDWEKGAVYE